MCEWDRGCMEPPTTSAVLLIPAKGWDFDAHSPLQLFLGSYMCERCYRKIAAEPRECFAEETKTAIREAMASMNRAQPDFRRTRAKKATMDDEMVLATRARNRPNAN